MRLMPTRLARYQSCSYKGSGLAPQSGYQCLMHCTATLCCARRISSGSYSIRQAIRSHWRLFRCAGRYVRSAKDSIPRASTPLSIKW